MKNLTQRWTQWGPFFLKLGLVFDFLKRVGEDSLPSPRSCQLCLREAKISTVNSDPAKIVDVQRLYEKIKI